MSTGLFLLSPLAASTPDEAAVRSTVTVVDRDEPASMLPGPPGYNDATTDPDTGGGLTTRSLASFVIPSERYVPNMGDANVDHNAIVNERISSSGTAAAREAAGQWGHGTMKVVMGIEPAQAPLFGDEYFAADAPENVARNMLTPAVTTDEAAAQGAAAQGSVNARDAYAAFLTAATGV